MGLSEINNEDLDNEKLSLEKLFQCSDDVRSSSSGSGWAIL